MQENSVQLGALSHIWIPTFKTNMESYPRPENINVIFTAVLISDHIRFPNAGVVQFTGLIPHHRIQWTLIAVAERLGARVEFQVSSI